MSYADPRLLRMIQRKTACYNPTPTVLPFTRVLDFGGGFGVHYLDAKAGGFSGVWAIVEQPEVVAMCQPQHNLRWFSSIHDAKVWLLGMVDLVHCNGALQYACDFPSILSQLTAIRAPTMIWERTFLDRPTCIQTSRLRDNGPGDKPLLSGWGKVRYPCYKIPKALFESYHDDYTLTGGDGSYLATLRSSR